MLLQNLNSDAFASAVPQVSSSGGTLSTPIRGESLTRMVAELRAEHLPLVNYLWNEWKEGETLRWKPKMEEHLSDWVAVYLQRDLKGRGIIVNRETQISRGQFTDVLVSVIPEACTGIETPRIDVVIEIKGSWHGEVKTAMKTQLVETYLRERKASVGLYLVGWYYVPGLHDEKPARVNSWEDLQGVLLRSCTLHRTMNSRAGREIPRFS